MYVFFHVNTEENSRKKFTKFGGRIIENIFFSLFFWHFLQIPYFLRFKEYLKLVIFNCGGKCLFSKHLKIIKVSAYRKTSFCSEFSINTLFSLLIRLCWIYSINDRSKISGLYYGQLKWEWEKKQKTAIKNPQNKQ